MGNLAILRQAIPSAQVSSLTTGSITLPSARGAFDDGTFHSIATVLVGSGGSSSVEFSSIPQTYSHLQIRAIMKDSEAGSGVNNASIRLNSDSGSNYAGHQAYANQSSASAAGYTSITSINVATYVTSTGAGSNKFSTGVIDIYDYSNTNKATTTRSFLGGVVSTSNGIVLITSGHWRNNAAVTTITLTPSTGTWVQNSHFALYGIKAAS